MGADCKSVGFAFSGSNPLPATPNGGVPDAGTPPFPSAAASTAIGDSAYGDGVGIATASTEVSTALSTAGLAWLPWYDAALLAGVLAALGLALAAHPRTRPAVSTVREVVLVLVLYGAWQFATTLRVGDRDAAEQAGTGVASVESALGWPTEAALQAPVLDHSWLVAFADVYYAVAHVPVFVVTLAWVLLRHRPDWPFARTTTAIVTGLCLVVQLWAVAPPRLLPELGVVDTALANGRSVYAAIPGANELSAMPSLHIAWAAMVALLVVVCGRGAWRWLAIAYPVATLWVVVVTGNHFILDGLVAVALLGVAVGVTWAFPSQRPRRFAPVASPATVDGPDREVDAAVPAVRTWCRPRS